MADQSLYNSTAQTSGSLALAHEKIIRAYISGAWVNITGDANNVAAVPTPVTVQRENYGNKGLPSVNKIGDSWVVSWGEEAVRNAATGAIVQPWLISLINIARAGGSVNKVQLQVFDAKDDALQAIQGNFSLAVTDLATGFADKGGFTFTATSDGVVAYVTSPIATTAPVLESALPTLKTVGDLLVLKGYKMSTVTSLTIDAIAVAKFTIVDDNTITILIPATVAGSAPVVATGTGGVSNSLPYTAV